MPWLSRSSTPIWLGVMPFLASLQMWSVTCKDSKIVVLLHKTGEATLKAAAPVPAACCRVARVLQKVFKMLVCVQESTNEVRSNNKQFSAFYNSHRGARTEGGRRPVLLAGVPQWG